MLLKNPPLEKWIRASMITFKYCDVITDTCCLVRKIQLFRSRTNIPQQRDANSINFTCLTKGTYQRHLSCRPSFPSCGLWLAKRILLLAGEVKSNPDPTSMCTVQCMWRGVLHWNVHPLKFSIIFMRSETKSAIWSVFIRSEDNFYNDKKRSFLAILSKIRHLKWMFPIWSTFSCTLKRDPPSQAMFSFDIKRIFSYDLQQNPLSEVNLSIKSNFIAIWRFFYSAIWSKFFVLF